MAKSGELKMPYLYGEARSAYETPMEWEAHYDAPEMESQWKRPYKYDSYPKMEWELAHPGQPLYPQPPGGPGIGADCEPKGDLIGGGAGYDPCNRGIDCATWAWNCAHRITKFEVLSKYGWIQSIQYLPGDVVRVTVCWDDAAREAGEKVGIQAVGAHGQNYISMLDFSACCPDRAICAKTCGSCTALSISYSSQQMTINQTQNLGASGGGGKYTWSISGGGSLSKTKGASTVYTAPASNASCLLNPTITLKDCCGDSKTLKIAINAYALGGTPCAYSTCVTTSPPAYPGNRCTRCFDCDGSLKTGGGANCSCPMPGTICVTTPPCMGYSAGDCAGSEGGACPSSLYDARTAGMITGGCCPAALL